MKNSLTLICALSILILVALACSAPDKSTSNSGPATSSPGQNSTGTKSAAPEAPAAVKVTATDLMQAYVDNKVKADDTYKDKTVEVSGVISEVGKDIMNSPYVALKTKEMIYTVQVYFTDEENKKLGDLKKGQSIKATGKCTGALGNVLIKEAVLSK
jgi:putative nucleic acid binding protein